MGKYLITGGAGFFGTIMTRYLLERGHECVCIDLCKSEIPESENGGADVVLQRAVPVEEDVLGQGGHGAAAGVGEKSEMSSDRPRGASSS